jgi:hypothetical protein
MREGARERRREGEDKRQCGRQEVYVRERE